MGYFPEVPVTKVRVPAPGPYKNPTVKCVRNFPVTPTPSYFHGRRAAVQMGGVLQYKWEVYCWVSLSSKLRSQEGTAIQMGGVLPYILEVYCSTFFETSRGWGF